MSKTIRYYRHSETTWNKEGRLQGWFDSELTEHGIKLAQAITWQPDIVFCSDLNRSITTAKFMFPNQKLHKSPFIREIDLGEWQGQTINQLQLDSHYRCYEQTPHLFHATTQEIFEMVTKRMLLFHNQLRDLPYEKIAVVSHGVALACLFCKLNNDSTDRLWKYMLSSATFRAYEVKKL